MTQNSNMKEHEIAELVNELTKKIKETCPNAPQSLRDIISRIVNSKIKTSKSETTAKSTNTSKECAKELNAILNTKTKCNSTGNAMNNWKTKYQAKRIINQNIYVLPDNSEIVRDEAKGKWE